ncbi:hypothetical protein S40288_11609 [Stachybotrys chartarum IBT 40288]|nr:hypothetical protein S40288_11609 [Stachybotrys chartarum IBT 40288]
MLIPPGPLDASHCSFLNMTTHATLVPTTNGTVEAEADMPAQLLCLHADGTGIYVVENETVRASLSNFALLDADATAVLRDIRSRVLATKWLFVTLVITTSFWWTLSWIVSSNVAAWIFWIFSVIETIAIIIIMALTREATRPIRLSEGAVTTSYGSLFFATLVILVILLAWSMKEAMR